MAWDVLMQISYLGQIILLNPVIICALSLKLLSRWLSSNRPRQTKTAQLREEIHDLKEDLHDERKRSKALSKLIGIIIHSKGSKKN